MALKRWTLQLLWMIVWTKVLCVSLCPRSCSCPALREVHCTFRHLSSIPTTLPKDTQRLNLGYNSLTEVEGSEVRSLLQLEMLMLHGNDIETVQSGAFYGLRSLQILKLSYNKLTSVSPGLFEGLVGLVRLHLDHNQISFIEPYSFSGLTSLKLLQLEGNALKQVHPHAFITISVLGHFWSSGLKHLHLSENLLEHLPSAALSTAPRLELLTLHSNPWLCDCGLHWLVQWGAEHPGVVKCKRERDSASADTCPQCFSPPPLNGSNILDLTADRLSCDRPDLRSPLKLWDSPMWAESEPDLPYTRDLEKPLGRLTFVLSDSHSNHAHVVCDVRRPSESSPVSWNSTTQNPDQVSVNVTLATALECEIDRETLQNLWQLVAYYYESPAILERGQQRGNTSGITYEYTQVINNNSPYFTELKGYMSARPPWLLQPRITLKLNRPQTTTKKLVMDLTTVIHKNINSYREDEEDGDNTSWAMIRQGGNGRVQTVLEGSKVQLECSVETSDPLIKAEWMLPDMTVLENSSDKMEITQSGELVVLNATLSDAGVYHCLVRTKARVDLMPFRVTVKERSLSPKAFNGEKLELDEGESFSLPCNVSSVQPSQTLWFLPKNQILLPMQHVRRAQVLDNGTLVVKRLSQEDAGEYSCLASNVYGVDMIAHIMEVRDNKSRAKTAQTSLTNALEDTGEGSGDFQEIIRPFATEFPKRVPFLKRVRVKDSKRKPNKSVKELDPSRWAEILAKANAKATEPSSTQWTTTQQEATTTAASVFTSAQYEEETDRTIPTLQIPALQTPQSSPSKAESAQELLATTASPDGFTQIKIYSEERRNFNVLPFRRRPPFGQKRPTRPRLRQSQFQRQRTTTTTTTAVPTTIVSTTDSRAEYDPEEEDGHYYEEDISHQDLTTVTAESQKQEIHSTVKPNHVTVTTRSFANTKTALPPKPNVPNQSRTSSRIVKVETKTVPARVEKVTVKPKPGGVYPVLQPVHPWLHRQNPEDQERWRKPDLDLRHHLHVPVEQRTSTNPKPGFQAPSTSRPWPLQHPWVHAPVTNRPDITAETARPLAPPTGNSGFRPNMATRPLSPTMDQVFFTQLRNRYRQAQLDRMAQMGKIVTPRPRTSFNKVPFSPYHPHRGYTPKYPPRYGPGPTAPSYSHTQPPPGYGKSYPSFYPTAQPRHQTAHPKYTTPHSKYPTAHPKSLPQPGPNSGGQWPIGGRVISRRPTVGPPLRWGGDAQSGSKPRIRALSAVSVSALAESDVFLPCDTDGLPAPTVSWTKVSTGATILANTKHGPRFEVFQNGTFVIKSVQLQDRGQYLCTAQNSFGSDRTVITLAVQTQAPRIAPPLSSDVSVYLGQSVSLGCSAFGKPAPHVSWILPDRTFVRDVGEVHSPLAPMVLFTNGTLHIHAANFSSKGDFKCIASNAAGADTVTYRVHVAALPPSISEKSTDTVLIQPGLSVYIHCSVKGEPPPSVKWTLPGARSVKRSQFVGRRVFVFPNGTLYMKNVLQSDAGRYECLALNPVGFAKRTIQIEISPNYPSFPAAPLPIPSPQQSTPSRLHSVTALYGSAVYLHCPESIGSKTGTFWQLPSNAVLEHRYSPERPIKVFRNGTLRILQLTETDGGKYTCVFNRPNGEEMEMFNVEVLMTPPRIEHMRTAQTRVPFGENFLVDCVVSGLPDPEVSWSLPDGTLINNALQSDDSGSRQRRYVIFTNGSLLLHQMDKTDEGDYTCTARNKLGTDERKVSVKVGPNAPQIKSSGPALTVQLGHSARLSCEAVGEPAPRITWISPRNIAVPGSLEKYEVLNNGALVIKDVSMADEGKYVCIARNSVGDDFKNVKVEIEPQEPSINGQKGKGYSKVMAVSYQTTLLDCKAVAKPEPRVWWVNPFGQSFNLGFLGGRFQVHGNGSLELRGVRKNDEGRYTCFAKNHLGESSLTTDVEVASIAEKPSFTFPNIEIIPIRQDGGEVVLECPAKGKPRPHFAWLLPNGTMLLPGVKLQRFQHHSINGTLKILQSEPNDKGVYRCLAKNVAGQSEKRYALEAGRKPVIRGSTGGLKIVFGQSLFLSCSAEGLPHPSISWTLPNGVTLDKPQSVARVTVFINGTLLLRHAATYDKGTYTCRASNPYGTTTASYSVVVTVHPPQISSTLSSITRVFRGTSVTLPCSASGVPKPEISWTLPGRTTILPNDRYMVHNGVHVTQDGSLVLQNPGLTNSGIYKCNAKSALGTDFTSTYLHVL